MNLLAPLLTLETVRLNLDVVSRKRLYEEAGLVFETSAGLSHTEAFDALFAREKLGSTCLGSGCALPHGRVEGITEPAAVFLRTAAPLSLDAPDGRPVQLFLCLLIPGNDDGMYLKILREAACLFGNKPLRNALLHAESEVKICELIHNWTPPADLHYEPDFSEDDEDA